MSADDSSKLIEVPSNEQPVVETRHTSRVVLSLVWAAAPLFTLGYATPICIGYAAVRLRSKVLWGCVAGYVILIGLFVATSLPQRQGSRRASGFSVTLFMVTMILGAVQTFALRDRVFNRARVSDPIDEAREEIDRREHARRLLRTDPKLARELRIGRPDLERRFDDGGLVDVNHVDDQVLHQLDGVDQSVIDKIVNTRKEVGGFSSLADMTVTLDLSPDALSAVEDRLVFIA